MNTFNEFKKKKKKETQIPTTYWKISTAKQYILCPLLEQKRKEEQYGRGNMEKSYFNEVQFILKNVQCI